MQDTRPSVDRRPPSSVDPSALPAASPAPHAPTPAGAAAAPSRGIWPRALSVLGLVVAVVLVGQFEVWRSMVEVWSTTTTYHHGFVIAPIALFLVWLRRDALRAARPRHELVGLPVLAGFALLAVLGDAGDVQLVRHVAAVGLLVAGIVTVLGREICRPIWFPLLFLFFMVPAGDEIVPLLQDLVARFSVFVLRLMEIPTFHDGILITIPTGVFEVAEACAGIRFLIANIVVTALFAYLALDRVWKWAAFLALGALIPIGANALRALGIILIAHWTDGEYAVGVDHLVYGWGFFTVIMLVILWIGTLMADRPVGVFAPPTARTRAAAGPWRASVAGLALVVAAAPAVYAHTVMRPPAAPATVSLAAPAAGSAWRTTDAATEPSPWRPRVVGADALRLDRFEANDVVVDVAQAYFAFERQGAELIYHDHRFVADDAWVRVRRGRTTVDVGGRAVDARFEVFRTRSESRLVLWWYWQDGRPSSDLVALKLTKAQQRLRGMFEPAAIVLVSTPFYDDFDDALERLRTFLATAVDLRPTVVATD